MNVGRGLFRAWILITALWIVGMTCMGYFAMYDEMRHSKWQYVHQVRKEIDMNKFDWSRPYYENFQSPSGEKLAVTFSQLGYQYVDKWDELVKEGELIRKKMPDESFLYLDTYLKKDDEEYLSRAFWDQRWQRYLKHVKLWSAIVLIPPLVLLILGWALLWVGRGFKTTAGSRLKQWPTSYLSS
jgi:hypothetical protein